MSAPSWRQGEGRDLRRLRLRADPLFTVAGFRASGEDLLARMMNPFLNDTIDRVGRDAPRKLGWNDRFKRRS